MNFSTPTFALSLSKKLFFVCIPVLLAALSACGKKDESQTVGQKLDVVVSKTEQAALEAKAKTESLMAKAGESMKSEVEKAKAVGKTTAESVTTNIGDSVITASVLAEFARDTEINAMKINVETKNGTVTLNGSAPSTASREKALILAKSVKGVGSVDNKLMVTTN